MAYCSKCGAQMTDDAAFCPRCGTPSATATPPAADSPTPPVPVIPPPATAAPPPAAARPTVQPAQTAAPRTVVPPGRSSTPPPAPAKGGRWWIAPAVVVALVLIAWLVLAGLPFGGDDEPKAEPVATETIAEGTAPAGTPAPLDTMTLEEDTAGTGAADDSFEIVTTTTQAPPGMATATQPGGPPPTVTAPPLVVNQPVPQPQPRTAPVPTRPSPVQTRPAPVQTRPAPVQTRPAPVQTRPAPAPDRTPPPVRVAPEPSREISPEEAANTLRGYITSTDYYRVGSNCIRVYNRGYRNVGYDMEVWDTCSGGATRRVGRWRVDSKTREVFRQRDDGRYLKP